jgi:hypothetical protein
MKWGKVTSVRSWRKFHWVPSRWEMRVEQEEVMSLKSKFWIALVNLSLAAVAFAAAGPGYQVKAT